jgi:hypothetical protein
MRVQQVSAAQVTDELYPLNYIQKINRETSRKRAKSKQGQSPDFSASFDSEAGRFVLGTDARRKLEEGHPNVDLDATLKIIEARVLQGKSPPIRALAYLETCLLTHGCVMKKGALITFDDGTTGRVKTHTDEELDQVEQKKPRETRSLSKAEEEILSKWRDS